MSNLVTLKKLRFYVSTAKTNPVKRSLEFLCWWILPQASRFQIPFQIWAICKPTSFRPNNESEFQIPTYICYASFHSFSVIIISKSISRISNGTESSASIWMMGATLNPNSSVAKEMDACLKDEIQTHSAYDSALRPAHHGVPFPGAAKKNAAVSLVENQGLILYTKNAVYRIKPWHEIY